MGSLLNGALTTKESRDHRSDQRKKSSVVYFLLVVDKSSIKIGYTDNFPKRLKEHESTKLGVKVDVKPLCVVRASYSDEQALLRKFETVRLNGEKEIFRADPVLVDFIRWLRDQYYVWVPEDDMAEIDRLDVRDAGDWMPNPERRKDPPVQKDLFSDFGPLNLSPRDTTADDFYTDEKIIRAAQRTFGGAIDCDPASHPVANKVVKATTFYSLHQDGTSKAWHGNVWLNPPFSEWQKWVPKIIEEWNSGRIKQMCVLVATRTLTAQYFSAIHENCKAICVFCGRIPFWGERAGSPDDGHAVFYFGNDVASFSEAFCELGTVYQPVAKKYEATKIE